jgi:hypothetical protein
MIRAVERILKLQGFSVGKVAVLIGGPDWPTSVLCGILNVSLPSMVLGTLPIVLVLAPTALAGAFSMKVDGCGLTSGWQTASSACILTTAVIQPASSFMAARATTIVHSMHREELAQPRPEHAEVEDLSIKQAEFEAKYRSMTRWGKLPVHLKVLLQWQQCLYMVLVAPSFCLAAPVASGALKSLIQSMPLSTKRKKMRFQMRYASCTKEKSGFFATNNHTYRSGTPIGPDTTKLEPQRWKLAERSTAARDGPNAQMWARRLN